MQPKIPLVLILLALGGCASQGPPNQYYSWYRQNELFSASHWQILAAQTASELRHELPAGSAYVRLEENNENAFTQGFDELLATELLHHGISVSREKGDTVVKVKVELIEHQAGRPTIGFNIIPTPETTDTEVIVTTAVFLRGYQVAGKSNVFYIHPKNWEEYTPPPPPPPPVSIVGS